MVEAQVCSVSGSAFSVGGDSVNEIEMGDYKAKAGEWPHSEWAVCHTS